MALSNQPLVSFRMNASVSNEEMVGIVQRFAEKEEFAIRVLRTGKPSSFQADLFRDDVRVSVSNPFEAREANVTVYALCQCQIKYIPQLRTTAERIANDLREQLSAAMK
jgi:hypothetical protein